MNRTYNHLLLKKETYIKDNKDMAIAGIIAVLIAYFIMTRPSFPSKEIFTWGNLLSVYGIAFYMGFSFLAGWKLLDGFTAKFFLFLPIIGWIFYFFIKIGLALFIGGTYFYSVYRFLNNLYQINRLNKDIAR